jgi:hypothetical protein
MLNPKKNANERLYELSTLGGRTINIVESRHFRVPQTCIKLVEIMRDTGVAVPRYQHVQGVDLRQRLWLINGVERSRITTLKRLEDVFERVKLMGSK